jgi:hypothetical protein
MAGQAIVVEGYKRKFNFMLWQSVELKEDRLFQDSYLSETKCPVFLALPVKLANDVAETFFPEHTRFQYSSIKLTETVSS